MIVRFYDILVDTLKDGEYTLEQLGYDITLEIPQRDLSEATERAEHISTMMDKLSEYSAQDVYSFRYETVN